jgi:hypothetical protein
VLNGPNADVPYPEECDDGNFEDDDGCGLCLRDRIVFISSESFHGYELNGLAGADARCRGLATLAKLPNAATYRAWLSDSQTSASERMVHGLGRYVLVNGLVVAKSWKDLVDGSLVNPINVTEESLMKKDVVWTSTLPDGSKQLGADFCADWQEGFGHEAYVGWSDDVTLWTQLPPSDANPSVCDGDQSLYCFEQD